MARMASGTSLRLALSRRSLYLNPHLRRTPLAPTLARSFNQSSSNPAEAAAPEEAGQKASHEHSLPRTKISHDYSLPRTKIYEHTRPQPRAPVRHRGRPAEFRVNDDQTVLDTMYERLFGMGPEGQKLLSNELKWQAITHVSFDHGRQPYNNKLAFLGMSAP